MSAEFSNETYLIPDFDVQMDLLAFTTFGTDICPPGALSWLGCFDMDWLDQSWGPLFSNNLGFDYDLSLYNDSFNVEYTSGVQNVVLNSTVNPVPVPEPGTLVLFSLGLLGLAATRRIA